MCREDLEVGFMLIGLACTERLPGNNSYPMATRYCDLNRKSKMCLSLESWSVLGS